MVNTAAASRIGRAKAKHAPAATINKWVSVLFAEALTSAASMVRHVTDNPTTVGLASAGVMAWTLVDDLPCYMKLSMNNEDGDLVFKASWEPDGEMLCMGSEATLIELLEALSRYAQKSGSKTIVSKDTLENPSDSPTTRRLPAIFCPLKNP